MKKQILLVFLALLFVVLACNAVSAAPVNNSTTHLAVADNNSTASSGSSAHAQKSAVKAVSAYAANGDVYVSKTGNDKTGDGSKTNPYATISKALEAVSNGGNIHILKGTYNEYSLIIDKNVHIMGESQTNTIVDAQCKGRIFAVDRGFNVLIQNLKLTNGFITKGSGGAIDSSCALTVINCTFTGNSADFKGGAIDCDVDNITVSGCTFIGNTAGIGGGAIANYGNLTVTGSTFTGNNATTSAGAIGGEGGNMAISGCTFTGNNADRGGAILFENGNLNVSGCTFTGNNAATFCGAVGCLGTLTVSGCTFTGNNAATFGGAILNAGTLTVRGSTFTGNKADQGGAVFNMQGTFTVNGCTFTGNQATMGAAIASSSGSNTAHFNRFANNSATQGNAIYNMGGSVDAMYNWWGSNSDPSGEFSGDVDYGPWLILTVKSGSAKNDVDGEVTLNVDLQHDSNGVYHDPSEGHVMDGTVVTFSTESGSLSPFAVKLVDGSGVTVFTAKAVGLASVNAAFDNETIITNLTVSQLKPVKPVKPVKPDSSSGEEPSGISGDNNKVHAADVIGMHKTGLPLNYLVLAILAVFSGLVMPRRKN